MSATVYIGAGSNRGDRFGNLAAAWFSIRSMLNRPEHSSLWETAPLIVEDQPRFLNMVFSGVYSGSPLQLLGELQRIESENGRDRSREVFKGPRTLDLDILLFGDERIRSDRLILPHPGIHSRAFVLTPLLEVHPEEDPCNLEFRKSLQILGDQDIVCIRKRSDLNFWGDGATDDR